MCQRFSMIEFMVWVIVFIIAGTLVRSAVEKWREGRPTVVENRHDPVAKANGETLDLLIQANAVEAKIRKADRDRIEALERRVEILEARLGDMPAKE